VAGPGRHDLHQAAGADEAGGARLAATLEEDNGNDEGRVQAATVGVLDERPRDLAGGPLAYAALSQHCLHRRHVLTIQRDVFHGLVASVPQPVHVPAEKLEVDSRDRYLEGRPDRAVVGHFEQVAARIAEAESDEQQDRRGQAQNPQPAQQSLDVLEHTATRNALRIEWASKKRHHLRALF
jgi:hypothetical protein